MSDLEQAVVNTIVDLAMKRPKKQVTNEEVFKAVTGLQRFSKPRWDSHAPIFESIVMRGYFDVGDKRYELRPYRAQSADRYSIWLWGHEKSPFYMAGFEVVDSGGVISHHLRTEPDEILHQTAVPVERIDGVKGLVRDMHDVAWSEARSDMTPAGLAAPQVGELLRIIILHVPGYDPMEVINPQIVKQRGSRFSQEQCLSLPGIQKEIKRPKTVKVVGLNTDGQRVSVRGPDVMAAVLCHEIDHLDGILITDKGAT